jgi:hypothetical protein
LHIEKRYGQCSKGEVGGRQEEKATELESSSPVTNYKWLLPKVSNRKFDNEKSRKGDKTKRKMQ